MADKKIVKKKNQQTEKNVMAAKEVEFSLKAPDAKEVFLAGEFNSWDTSSLPMKKDKQGVWKVKVKLPPGRYEYKLFVDGTWAENPVEEESSPNPFGTRNSVKVVE